MKLYLDDDSVDRLLIRLLRAAGHEVQIPADARLVGAQDPVHFAHAIATEHVLITGNNHDFSNLHELILTAGGRHPGVLVVCTDNDRSRDMTPRSIVRAIANVDSAGFDLHAQIQILNHWR